MIFDENNKIYMLQYWAGTGPVLVGTDTVYYFGSTAPSGPNVPPSITHFFPIDDGDPASPNLALTVVGENEIVIPVEIAKQFIMYETLGLDFSGASDTNSYASWPVTTFSGGELSVYSDPGQSAIWGAMATGDLTGWTDFTTDLGKMTTSPLYLNYFVNNPKKVDIPDLDKSIHDLKAVLDGVLAGGNATDSATVATLAASGSTKFKALIDELGSAGTFKEELGAIQGYYVKYKEASLTANSLKLNNGVNDEFFSLQFAADLASLPLTYTDTGNGDAVTAHQVLEIGVIYGETPFTSLETSLDSLYGVDTESVDKTSEKALLQNVVGNLTSFDHFYANNYGPENLNSILTTMGHDGSTESSFYVVTTNVPAGFEYVVENDSSAYRNLKFWDLYTHNKTLILNVKTGSTFTADLDDISGIHNFKIVNSTGATVALDAASSAMPSQNVSFDGNFDTSALTASWNPTLTVNGTTGNDTLNGTSANENIDGLAGDDVINGKGGDDVLTGAGGADKFVVAASDGGHVRIADFEDGVDSWEVTLVGGEKLSSATFNPANAADWGGGMKPQNEIGDNEWSIVGGLLTYKGGSLAGLNLPDPVYTPFEIVEIDGERYGDIITFGIKLKDSEVGNFSSDMFASISMQINWQDGEYEFFNYEAGISTPSGTDIANETADSGTYLGLENYDEANDYITIGALAPGGFTYGQDPTPAAIDKYLAKIMLTRTANNTSNDITLTKSNYSQISDPLTISKPQPKDFTFDYSQDTVTVKLETPSGVVAPDPVLFVSSDTVTDGLSIVPVMKLGNIVKYEIVLNVSKPTVMKAGKTVTTVDSIDIDDARIFDGSIVDKSGLATGAEALAAVGDATFTVTDFLGSSLTVNDASSMPGGNAYSEHYFFDKLEAALDSSNTSVTMADLTTSRGMTIDVAGLAEPIIAAIDLEDFTGGRYVLGEFTALAYGSGIEFGDDADDPSSMININARQVTNAEKASGYVTTVNDGSDIVLLGNSYYENPMTNQDAVGAEDALGALMIATDMLHSSSQAQMIAADFDESGDVSSWDAYNIMRYAVYGEETGGDYPTWSYIDNVEMVDPFMGPMTKDTVSFDNNIDLFVGSDTTINATAVLKGDVSDSYETLSSSIDPRAAWQTKFMNEFNTTYDIKVDMSDTFTATDLVRVTGTSVADGERAAMLQISSSKTSSDTIKIDEHSYMNAIMLKGSYADATAVKTRLIDLDLQVGETAAGAIGTGDAIAIIYSADGTSMNKVAEMKFLGSVTKDTDFTTSTIIDVVDTTATLTFTGGVWETHDIVFIA